MPDQAKNMDKIILGDMAFFAYHGLFGEEKSLGQRFFVDLECELDLRKVGHSDAENDTVRYDQLALCVQDIVTQKRFNLIESLAEAIAGECMNKSKLIQSIMVRVRKPDAPIPMIIGNVAVEIVRTRDDYPATS